MQQPQQQQQPQIIYMMMPSQFQQAPFPQMFQMPMQQMPMQPVPVPVSAPAPAPQPVQKEEQPQPKKEQSKWRAEPPASSLVEPDLIFSFNSKYQWTVFEKHAIAKMLNRFYNLNSEFKRMMNYDYNQINIIKPYHSSGDDESNKHFNIQLFNQKNASQYPQVFRSHHFERRAKEPSSMFHVYISVPRLGVDDITIYKMTEVQSL